MQHVCLHVNSKLGREHTKAPLAAALSAADNQS